MDEEDNENVVVVVKNVYGDICLRKARRERQKVLVREMFYDYATNTTLHGLPYTTKRGLTLIEKLFWLVTFIASICMCAYLIHNVWVKWVTSPVIVTISEDLVSVRQVPFPSITICPQIKSKAALYNYTSEALKFQALFNKSDEALLEKHRKEFYSFDDVTSVCIWGRAGFRNLSFYSRHSSNAELARNIIRVAPKMTDVFYRCSRGHNIFDDEYCKNTVTHVLTSEGVCFNVNSLASNEILRLENIHKEYLYMTNKKPSRNWTIEHGYSSFGPEVYPVPGKENSAFPDLQMVMIDRVKDHDAICNVLNSGYKVYIHHPADLPQSSLYYYAATNDYVSSMALSFSILNTSETLRSYPPHIRQCYFADERYLKYFKIYTANNCRLECLTNYTFNLCGCIDFYMPYESAEQICTPERVNCTEDARELLNNKIYNKEDNDCLCLPSCNSVDYDAEILKTDFNLKKLHKSVNEVFNFQLNVNGSKFSKLEMYFKRPRFVSMRRSELFGLTDFLANIGGLLGLFLGFSFLSLVELFYFLTLRLCCMLKKDLKEEKKQRRNTITVTEKY